MAPEMACVALRKPFIGDPGLAAEVAARAAAEVPAYSRFLEKAGPAGPAAGGGRFEDLPATDKASYCLTASYSELIPASARNNINGFFSSSGSSGRPFCWPRAKDARSSLRLADWLEENFRLGGRPTLAVVALKMDGWTAGLNSSLGLNQLAQEAGFPFMVHCPGADYAQALRTIAQVEGLVERVVVFIYPAAIPYFLGLAEELGVKLPVAKLRFAATGDPFSEAFREHLDGLCGASWPDTALAGFSYSSADTRVIGSESPASRALARLLHKSEDLRLAFGLGDVSPNIYPAVPAEELPLIEEVGGELLFTRWQPVPIVRYNLHDKGELWDWAAARELVLSASIPAELEPLRAEVRAAAGAPDLVAVYGRSRAVYFYGMYLDEAALCAVMERPELAALGAGLFQVSLSGTKAAPRLSWEIELRGGGADDGRLYRALVAALSEAFPHFGVNYANFLNKWDKDPAKRIFEINVRPYPQLSDRLRVSGKHRTIKVTGTGG
ncbi:MAG: hypothetical protein NDI60_04000 [Elusimicrobiales bacterium]|nr:hypothetical protein [Elusimicrobiales bacterium]